MSKSLDEFYTTADKFVNLANTLSKEDKSGTIGSAMRFAASRYSAFEMSLTGRDLAKEKEAIKVELLTDYSKMLDQNLDDYIHHVAKKNKEEGKEEEIKKEKIETKLKIFS